ncbi:MAG: DUF222 domain-containing protein [Jiangellaceae bacterium]
MFEDQLVEAAVDYAFVEPLVPGAVDPVRLAVLLGGFEAGNELLDPEEFALFGTDPDVDPGALFGPRPDVGPPSPGAGRSADPEWSAGDGPVEPTAVVPGRLPGVEGMSPGPKLAGVLATADVSALGAYEVVEAVAAWQRVASWAAAGQATAIAELARRVEMRPVEAGRSIESMTPQRITGMEVAARLQLTPATGEALVARSLCLTETLPATHAALAVGRIDPRRAEVIADELRRHDPAVARQVEAEVIDRAEGLTAPRLRRAVKDSLHRLAPATVEQRRQAAASRRLVSCTPAADGMAWLEAYLPAEDAAALMAAIEAAVAAMKRTDPDDGRTLDQLRADVLAQMGWTALRAGRLGGCVCGQRLDDQHRHPVAVNVTVAATTLLGLDELPGQLAGYGPIPAEVARRLAADATWRRLLTDPASGVVLDYGRTRYEPPSDLVDHVVVRDRTCRWPGCDRPAYRCELDHTLPYPLGPTAAGNLGPLCKAHHIAKHHSRWRVRQPAPGRFEWITPTGHVHTVEPEPIGPVGLSPPDDPLEPVRPDTPPF